jgi:hypothetical protein
MKMITATDIEGIIKAAKLGRSRREAQEDTCTVFAAALHDVLAFQGIDCQMATAEKQDLHGWAHSVVQVGQRYYDSMGEFSTDIYRARSKIHPKVTLDIRFKRDARADCYESEFEEMYDFYLKMLSKAATGRAIEMAV